MRQRKGKVNKIAPFIVKLVAILDDLDNVGIIEWFSCNSFIILNLPLFTKQVLHKYCKHANLSSFIRQLNAYGFSKEKSTEQTNIYTNSNFIRNNKNKLKLIQRIQTNHTKENKQSDKTRCNKHTRALAQKCLELQKNNKDLKNSNKIMEQQIGVIRMEIEQELEEIKSMCYNLEGDKNSGRSFILNDLLGEKWQKLILNYMSTAMVNKTDDQIPESHTWLQYFLKGSTEIVGQAQETFENIEGSQNARQESQKCPSLYYADRIQLQQEKSFMNENPVDFDDLLY